MSASDLTVYITAQRAAGMTDSTIRKTLLAKGWPAHDIDEALGARIAPVPTGGLARPARNGTKVTLTLMLVAVTAVYALWQVFGTNTSSAATLANTIPQTQQQPATQPQTTQAATEPSSSPSSASPSSSSGVTHSTPPAPAAPPKPKGQYVDGNYTGSVADAYYGYVQVQAVIQGGKIADVRFLQYPNSHSTSVYINSQAMPYLTQEAIQAQSANINGVSGATATSQAFAQSLSSALAKAKA